MQVPDAGNTLSVIVVISAVVSWTNHLKLKYYSMAFAQTQLNKK